jgi:hypothetical protein
VHPRGQCCTDWDSELVIDTTKTECLEKFWDTHKAPESTLPGEGEPLLDSPEIIRYEAMRRVSGTPKRHGRNRSASDGTALIAPGHNLSTYHPAWSLPNLLDTFGPLIFPIHRAALLRKRLLITAHAPVQEICNFGKHACNTLIFGEYS